MFNKIASHSLHHGLILMRQPLKKGSTGQLFRPSMGLFSRTHVQPYLNSNPEPSGLAANAQSLDPEPTSNGIHI